MIFALVYENLRGQMKKIIPTLIQIVCVAETHRSLDVTGISADESPNVSITIMALVILKNWVAQRSEEAL